MVHLVEQKQQLVGHLLVMAVWDDTVDVVDQAMVLLMVVFAPNIVNVVVEVIHVDTFELPADMFVIGTGELVVFVDDDKRLALHAARWDH